MGGVYFYNSNTTNVDVKGWVYSSVNATCKASIKITNAFYNDGDDIGAELTYTSGANGTCAPTPSTKAVNIADFSKNLYTVFGLDGSNVVSTKTDVTTAFKKSSVAGLSVDTYVQDIAGTSCPSIIVNRGGGNWQFIPVMASGPAEADPNLKAVLGQDAFCRVANGGVTGPTSPSSIFTYYGLPTTYGDKRTVNDFKLTSGGGNVTTFRLEGMSSTAGVGGAGPLSSLAATASGGGGSSAQETCNLTGVGWIVCPLTRFLAEITDKTYALVEQLLVFNPTSSGSLLDTNNPIFKIWENMRNLANIAFIGALFVVIYAQATSMGINAYGIRKMLPRLLAAAVLVNLSYYICIFGVDISNIIGAGIDGIIKSVPLSGGANTSVDTTGGSGAIATLGLGLIATTLLASSIAAAGGIAAALAGLLVFIPVILLAVLTALVVLVGRQALLIILIIISPLAFAAFILPNTEKLFDSWRKAFVTMLVFYPLVAILFAGSQVAASVLRLSANSGDATGQLIKIMSVGVQVFPLFGLPFLLKFSGGVLGRIAGVVNNPNKGPFDRMRKDLEGRRDASRNLRTAKALGEQPKDYTGKRFGQVRRASRNMFSPTGRAQSAAERNYQQSLAKGIAEESSQEYIAKAALEGTTGDQFVQRMARTDNPAYIAAVKASAQATADKIEKQNVSNRETLFRKSIPPGDLSKMQAEFGAAVKANNGKGDTTAIKALQNLMISNGAAGIDALRTATAATSPSAHPEAIRAMKQNLQEVHGQTMKQKSTDMLYWSTDVDGKTFETHSLNPESWSKLSINELASQSGGSLAAANTVGGISPEKAGGMLSDNRILERLSGDQIATLELARARSDADYTKLVQDARQAYAYKTYEHAKNIR